MRHWKSITAVLLLLILSSQCIAYPHYGDYEKERLTEEPIVAYKLSQIPTIDGQIGENEWNDTKIYTLEYQALRMGSDIEDDYNTFIVKYGLKHDNDNLYVHFNLSEKNDVPVIHSEYTMIYLNRYMDVNTSISFMRNSTKVHDLIYCADNETAWFGRMNLEPWLLQKLEDVKVGFSSTNSSSTYELQVPLSYFNTTNRYVPFNLAWSYNYGSSIGSIGKKGVLPGMILSDIYYVNDKDVSEDAGSPIFSTVVLIVGVAVISSGITFVITRKKYAGKD